MLFRGACRHRHHCAERGRSRSSSARAASLLALLLLGSGTLVAQPEAPAAAAPPIDPSPVEIRAELRAICEEVRHSDDPYFGRANLEALSARLAQPGLSSVSQAGLRGQLANEHLKQGEAQKAIDLLIEARELAREADLPSSFELRLTRDLGLAYLRLAEDENCVHAHVGGHRPGACTLPVGPESLHQKPDSTRAAAREFAALLEASPKDPLSRWLLTLSTMLAGDYPEQVAPEHRLPEGAFENEAAFSAWSNVAPQLGIDELDLAGGSILDDFDGDGLIDIVTSTWDPCGPMKAFRNVGDGSFENVGKAWGLADQLGGLNLMPADYDNDGDLDILLLRGAWMVSQGRMRNSLLRNDLSEPGGRFVDVTRSAGVAEPAYPTQAAGWADYDGDGDLDLYVGNEATEERPYPSQLFRNEGDGTFTDVAVEAGVQNFSFAKSVAWGDYDNDGDPDLYVANFGANRLYRNDTIPAQVAEDGTEAPAVPGFTDMALAVGVSDPFLAFPSWFFDYNNDGRLDLFATDYGTPVEKVAASYCCPEALAQGTGGNPILYRNDGALFTDVSRRSGFDRPLLPMGSNFGDLDNDGWLDIYLGTGIPNLEALMPNVLLKNDGGRGFADVSFSGGFGILQKGHGVAFADIDNDGDQDLFIQLGGAFPSDAFYNALFENPGNDNAWVGLRLKGTKANRSGLGARVAVRVRSEAGQERTLHLQVGSGGSFGASTMRSEIGLGDATSIEEIEIRWPGSGTVQRFTEVAPNAFYRATEGEPELEPLSLPRITLGNSNRAAAHPDAKSAQSGHHQH